MASRWRDDETSKFIDIYKAFPCLWDNSSIDYKNREKRDNAYKCLQEHMDISDLTINDIKTKIKNLRSTYHQEVKKIKNSKKSGIKYKPRLSWFESFKDIMKKEMVRPSETNIKLEPESSYVYLEEMNVEKTLFDESNNNMFREPKVQTPAPKKLKRNVERLDKANTVSDNLQKLDNNSSSSTDTDEFQIFANSIAVQLKKIPLDRALRVQIEIQKIIANERIQLLRTIDPLKPQESNSGSQTEFFPEFYEN